MKADIVNLSNAKVSEIELDNSIFEAEIRTDIMARVVKWQLAKARSGNHKVKTRAEVSHSTKKPFKQKGTGRARQGMTSVSQMRGGGVVFGPVVRDHSHKLLKKVRKLGLKSAISSKLQEGNLIIVDDLSMSNHKTSGIFSVLKALNVTTALFVDADKINDNFRKASSNIIKIDVLPQIGLNVYDILQHDKLVLTVEAVNKLTERLND